MVKKIETRGRPKGSGVKYTDDYIEDLSIKLDKWIADPTNFWLGTFAAEQGFNRHRLNEFAVKNETFKAIYEKAKQVQENKIFMLGLSNKGNPTMCIFALKNVAGWRDMKVEEENEELKDTELVFTNVPLKNGELPENLSRYLN